MCLYVCTVHWFWISFYSFWGFYLFLLIVLYFGSFSFMAIFSLIIYSIVLSVSFLFLLFFFRSIRFCGVTLWALDVFLWTSYDILMCIPFVWFSVTCLLSSSSSPPLPPLPLPLPLPPWITHVREFSRHWLWYPKQRLSFICQCHRMTKPVKL